MINHDFFENVISQNDFLELIHSAQNGNISAKNNLIKLNLGLVNKVVQRYLSSGIDKDDLFQLGCIGLVKAIERFDSNLGFMFSSYAVPMINGEIRRFIRDTGIIKISRELKDIHWKTKRYIDSYFKKNGKEPTLNEISINLEIPLEKIKSAMIALAPIEHFDIYESDNEFFQLDLGNNIIKEDKLAYTDLIELKELIKELPILEQKVIRLRYFNDLTQEKTGKILGISQVQVSRIEKKALKLLKKEYKN